MMGTTQVPYTNSADQSNFTIAQSIGASTSVSTAHDTSGTFAGSADHGHAPPFRSADDAWSVQNQLLSSSPSSRASSPSSASHHATSYRLLPHHQQQHHQHPNGFGGYLPLSNSGKTYDAPLSLAPISPTSLPLGSGARSMTSSSYGSGHFITTTGAGVPALFPPSGSNNTAGGNTSRTAMIHHHARHVDKHSHEECAILSTMSAYGRGVVVDPGEGGSSSGGAASEHYGSGNYGRASNTTINGAPTCSGSTRMGMNAPNADTANLVELSHIATSSPLYATAAPAMPTATTAVAFSTVSTQSKFELGLMKRKGI